MSVPGVPILDSNRFSPIWRLKGQAGTLLRRQLFHSWEKLRPRRSLFELRVLAPFVRKVSFIVFLIRRSVIHLRQNIVAATRVTVRCCQIVFPSHQTIELR